MPLILLAFAPAFAHAQDSLDISIPSSFPLAMTGAYGSNNTFDVWGPIVVFKSGGGFYVAIPASAPAGEKLLFFQEANASRALFRNNTLALPIEGQSASFLLATGGLMSDGQKFNGQVTGMELGTRALDSESASVVAAIYLDELPGRASYRVALTENEEVEKAITGEASKGGQPGKVKLMVEVSGTNPEAQGSIAYSVVRMKADGPEPDGNVTAYRYYNGAVARLPCKAIASAGGPIYETIYAGPGTFAFVGPFPEPPLERASLQNVLIFSGAIAALLLALVTITITALKRPEKKGR